MVDPLDKIKNFCSFDIIRMKRLAVNINNSLRK